MPHHTHPHRTHLHHTLLRTALRRLLSALLLLTACAASSRLCAQSPGDDPEPLLLPWDDDSATADADEPDLSALAEWREHPLNLNTATRADLERLGWLTPRLVEELLAYVYIHGPMRTVSELMLVPGMDLRTARLLASVAVAGPAADVLRRLPAARHEVELRTSASVPLRQGDLSGRYTGTAPAHLLRYEGGRGERLRWGLTAEKDRGEPLWTRGGPDLLGVWLALRDAGPLSDLVLGRYRLRLGQGLLMNTAFSLPAATELPLTALRPREIRPATTASEGVVLQGAAASAPLGRGISATAFVSHRPLDATVTSAGEITATTVSGLHRTTAELRRRHSAAETLLGARLTLDGDALRLGLTATHTVLSRPMAQRTELWARRLPAGRRFTHAAADWTLVRGRWRTEGEVAASAGGSAAALVTVRHDRPSRGLHALLRLHHYSPGYHTPWAAAADESGEVRNSTGATLAAQADVRRLTLMARLAVRHHPTPAYRISRAHNDLRFDLTATRRGSPFFSARYTGRLLRRDVPGGGPAAVPAELHRLRLRHDTDAPGLERTARPFGLRTTLDLSAWHQQNAAPAYGSALTVRARLAPRGPEGWTLAAQASLFAAPAWDARLWALQPSMPHSLSIVPLYGRGARTGALLTLPLSAAVRLRLLATHLWRADASSIGSDLDATRGHHRLGLEASLTLRFRARPTRTENF